MKVLILNSSPLPYGAISQMLNAMADELSDCGFEVTQINVNNLDITPCRGCMHCRSAHQCSLHEDDAQRVLSLMQQSNRIIFGAPCYWGNMPGTLKVLFDRIVYGLIFHSQSGTPLPLMKGKKAVVVTTSTTQWPWNRMFHQTSGVIRALSEIFRWSGIKLIGSLQRGDTHNRPINDNDLTKARRLARKLL